MRARFTVVVAALKRPVLEFSTLGDARADGFTLTGSGRATVTRPPRNRPRAPYLAARLRRHPRPSARP
jgi:hypothetical protein